MADPHFAHTLTYVCEHNDDGALGIVVNKPIDMTLSALFEQIDVPLADADAARRAGALRRPGADRPRLRAAPAARQLAVDAGDQRRHRAHDVEGRPRGGRPRRGAAGRVRLAGLRRLVGGPARAGDRAERVAHRRRRRRRAVRPAGRARGCPRRCSSSASTSRGCPTTSGTPDAWLRRHRRPPSGTRARLRFRHAPDRRRGRQHADARRASADDDRRRGATPRASPRSRALVDEWQPGALVVGLPVHADGTRARDDRARASASRASSKARFGLPVARVDERCTTQAARPRSREAGVRGRARDAARDAGRGAADPAGMVR